MIVVSRPTACLADAYQTLLTCDFAEHRRVMPALAGLSLEAWITGVRKFGPALNVGRMTKVEAFGQILRDNGLDPDPALVRALADRDRELLLAHGYLYPDALPFLQALRARGIKIAIVSNCSEGTRELLVKLGVDTLADAVVLSCEVGSAKPDAQIFTDALKQLDVPAEAALFVDDQPRFCAGAVALGITAAQIVRDGPGKAGSTANATPEGARLVFSLAEAEAMFGE
jgi:putative hydrolase of the HAD superfamily